MKALIIAVFYAPDNEDYQMDIMVWDGTWRSYAMSASYGEGTFPTHWMYAPEYPETLIPMEDAKAIH